MTRDDLNARHATVIRRHWRDLTDSAGQPTPGLLDDLAAITDDHAADVTRAAAIKQEGATQPPRRPARSQATRKTTKGTRSP